jgi:DNA-binding transcriptional regulator YdaS (Cro superfamily)
VTYDDLIARFGSQAAAARALHVSQPTVWAWKTRSIPFDRQYEIELATDGALVAKLEDDQRITKRRQEKLDKAAKATAT